MDTNVNILHIHSSAISHTPLNVNDRTKQKRTGITHMVCIQGCLGQEAPHSLLKQNGVWMKNSTQCFCKLKVQCNRS